MSILLSPLILGGFGRVIPAHNANLSGARARVCQLDDIYRRHSRSRMSTMNCPNCGYQAQGKFCTMCGTRVSEDVPRTPPADYAAVWPGNQPVHQPAAGTL